MSESAGDGDRFQPTIQQQLRDVASQRDSWRALWLVEQAEIRRLRGQLRILRNENVLLRDQNKRLRLDIKQLAP